MNLYFPTSSLNFNDIFATESISPKYIYAKRSFGTRSHFITELNPNEKFITLFTKPPYFELVDKNDSDYEQYPLLIEIKIDSLKEQTQFIKVSDDIYITTQTIYFQRENLKLYFFSNEHLTMILTKSKLINESKLVPKYQPNFQLLKPNVLVKYDLKDIKYPYVTDDSMMPILEFDRIYNSIKGFYYFYVIKKYLNEFLQIHQEYKQNLKRSEDIQRVLDYKDNELNQTAYALNLILQTAENLQKKRLEEVEHHYDNLILQLNPFFINSKTRIKFNNNLVDIDTELKVFQLILNIILQNPKSQVGNVNNEEVCNLIELVGKAITNEINTNSYTADIISIHKRIVLRVIDINVENLHSVVLKNFFTFVLKLNNIEELNHFINLKNIKNCYFCYCFYGAFFGFSGLSKILTRDLFSSTNIDLFDIIDYNLYILTKNMREDISYNFKLKLNNPEIVKKYGNHIQLHLDNPCNITTDSTQLLEIDNLLYNELKRIKESKTISSYIKKKNITMNSNKNEININFEKMGNNNVNITFSSKDTDKIYKIYLKYTKECTKDEKCRFKKNLTNYEINSFICAGNYPIFYFKVQQGTTPETSLTSLDDKHILLNYLQSLNSQK